MIRCRAFTKKETNANARRQRNGEIKAETTGEKKYMWLLKENDQDTGEDISIDAIPETNKIPSLKHYLIERLVYGLSA